ncbi:hypothetical protein GQR58_009244 [Nymphon striatum]|nr:hypothetical protein GQR58_009244 [Nymphon striatum]
MIPLHHNPIHPLCPTTPDPTHATTHRPDLAKTEMFITLPCIQNFKVLDASGTELWMDIHTDTHLLSFYVLDLRPVEYLPAMFLIKVMICLVGMLMQTGFREKILSLSDRMLNGDLNFWKDWRKEISSIGKDNLRGKPTTHNLPYSNEVIIVQYSIKPRSLSYVPALFESKCVMRPANKATLADALWTPEIAASPGPTGDVQYVLDGGALLHRIPWTKGTTWETIFAQYTNYVARKYGKAIVVFDGYTDDPSTKDCTHLKRNDGSKGTEVHFTSAENWSVVPL